MLLMHNVRHVGSHKTVQTKRSQSKVKPDHFSSSPQCTGYGNGICPPPTLLLTSDFRVTNKKLILFNDPQTDDNMSYMISTQFYLIWDKNSKKENVWFFHVMVLDRARDSEYKKVGHENELFRPCHCHYGHNTGIRYVYHLPPLLLLGVLMERCWVWSTHNKHQQYQKNTSPYQELSLQHKKSCSNSATVNLPPGWA